MAEEPIGKSHVAGVLYPVFVNSNVIHCRCGCGMFDERFRYRKCLGFIASVCET